jgi:hypothetical protein
VPENEWPDDYRADILANWQAPFGDSRQELVFIGQNVNAEFARSELDACLLTDAELAAGADAWAHYPDQFPAWLVDE